MEKCDLYGIGQVDFSAVTKTMEHVINRVRFTQRRSVVVLPHLGFDNHTDVSTVIKRALDDGIVVVTGAGI